MKSYLSLIPISARVHRKQSFMTRICIVLAVFLVTSMFGLADMYLQGLITEQKQINGNWHYQLSSLDEEKAALISALPEVSVSGWHNMAASGYTLNGQPFEIIGQDEEVFNKIYGGKITEGDYPGTENEAVLSLEGKKLKGLCIGDPIEIELPNGKTVPFTISGFMENPQNPVPESGLAAVLTPNGLNALESLTNGMSADKKYMIQFSRLCNMPETIAEVMEQTGLSKEQLTANEPLLSMLGQLKGNNAAQIYSVAFALSILVMLTCVLMISSSLNSNIAQRTAFFGMLRCLGASKRQLLRFVRLEGLYWCVASIPTGLAAGIIVDWILSAVMRTVSPARLSYMPVLGISWISLAAGSLLGIFTVLLASRSPAKKASQTSPLEAVSGNTRKGIPSRKAASTRYFKIETSLGLHHAHASGKNFFLMTGAYAVCITLFLGFSTIVNFMENAMMPKPWTPEMSIVPEDSPAYASQSSSLSDIPRTIDNTLAVEIGRLEKVKRAYGRMFAYDIPAVIKGENRNVNLISYEDNQFSWAEASLSQGSIEAVKLEENQALFVYNETLPVQVADRITLSVNGTPKVVTVAGILSDTPLARDPDTETIICSEKTFTDLTGQTGYTIIDIQFQNNADGKDVETVKNMCPDGMSFPENLAQIQEQRRFYYAFSVLVYGFLSMIAAITAFHIMNTIHMSIAANLKQYGAMRAIGMSSRQLVKMITAQAAAYAVTGSITGCILGVPLHMAVYVSLITTFWGLPWRLPATALGTIICIILLTTALAILGPSKRLRDISVAETL